MLEHDQVNPYRRHRGRFTAPPGATRRLSTAVGLLALLMSLIVASAALAGKPTGEFAVFNHCPLASAGVNECVYSKESSGELRFGSMDVPIKNPITLQGGLIVTKAEETFVNPTEGLALSATPEEVPGGFESEPVSLTLELVGSVVLSRPKLSKGEGVALKLPVRAQLKNPAFGEECFIGSAATPITLNLTTGVTSPPSPNKAIKGTPGTFESKEAGTLEIFKGDSLVENAFSVPSATGCGGGAFKEIINPLVNSAYGLPAAAGHNTAILSGTSEFATAQAVKNSE
jgi:hypothetical protein